MNKPYREGYWWVLYKDFNILSVVELKFETWDHTRDGDRWVIYDGDYIAEEGEFHKYRPIQYIEEPQWPYE